MFSLHFQTSAKHDEYEVLQRQRLWCRIKGDLLGLSPVSVTALLNLTEGMFEFCVSKLEMWIVEKVLRSSSVLFTPISKRS